MYLPTLMLMPLREDLHRRARWVAPRPLPPARAQGHRIRFRVTRARPALRASSAVGACTADAFANWGHTAGNPYIDLLSAMPKYVASRSLTQSAWNATLLGPDPSSGAVDAIMASLTTGGFHHWADRQRQHLQSARRSQRP